MINFVKPFRTSYIFINALEQHYTPPVELVVTRGKKPSSAALGARKDGIYQSTHTATAHKNQMVFPDPGYDYHVLYQPLLIAYTIYDKARPGPRLATVHEGISDQSAVKPAQASNAQSYTLLRRAAASTDASRTSTTPQGRAENDS